MKNFFKIIKEELSLFVGVGLFTLGLFDYMAIPSGRAATHAFSGIFIEDKIYLVTGAILIVFWLVKTDREKIK